MKYNYIFTNDGIVDISLNTVFSYNQLILLTTKYIDSSFISQYNPALYRATIYQDYLYICLDGNLYKISNECLTNGCLCENDISLQLEYLDNRIGGLVIVDNKLYILETSFSRIRQYNIDSSGNIDKLSLYIPELYPKKYKLPYSTTYTTELIVNYLLEAYSTDNYKPLTKLLIDDGHPNKLICINSTESIDIIDINTWTVESFPQNVLYINNAIVSGNLIYYVSSNVIYAFSLDTLDLIGPILNCNIFGTDNYEYCNLWIRENTLHYSMRFIGENQDSKTIVFNIDINTYGYSMTQYSNMTVYSNIIDYS